MCPPGLDPPHAHRNKQFTKAIETKSRKLAPIAEDVPDLGPQPVRQGAQVARHELTQLPAAAWCEACVKGRGREAPRLCVPGRPVRPRVLERYKRRARVALFASCRSSTNLFATPCATKGPKDTHVVAAFASWIWELGHAWLIIQSDGERAILAPVAAFRDKVIADGEAEQ